MKIHRSQLPEAIAKALAPRTFAQERPEDDQAIEVKNIRDEWMRGTFYSPMCSLIDNSGRSRFIEGHNLWRPTLEIEDDAPEPSRVLPEPGSYFVSQKQLAIMSTCGEKWGVCGTESGHAITPYHAPLADLPTDNWQPFDTVIAQAARAEELEAELLESQTDCEKWRTHFNQRTAERDELQAKLKQAEAKSEELEDELNQEQHARRHWEQCSESHCAEANKLEEKRTNQRAELAKQNAQIRELQAKLKQQDERHKEEMKRAFSREDRLLAKIGEAVEVLGRKAQEAQ